MNDLPKFNFIFLHMPVAIANKLLCAVQRIINSVKKKPPRVRDKVIQ